MVLYLQSVCKGTIGLKSYLKTVSSAKNSIMQIRKQMAEKRKLTASVLSTLGRQQSKDVNQERASILRAAEVIASSLVQDKAQSLPRSPSYMELWPSSEPKPHSALNPDSSAPKGSFSCGIHRSVPGKQQSKAEAGNRWTLAGGLKRENWMQP